MIAPELCSERPRDRSVSSREGGPVDQRACAELCSFFRAEIDRIQKQGTRFKARPA